MIATHQLYHMNFIPPASVAAPPKVLERNLHYLGVADEELGPWFFHGFSMLAKCGTHKRLDTLMHFIMFLKSTGNQPTLPKLPFGTANPHTACRNCMFCIVAMLTQTRNLGDPDERPLSIQAAKKVRVNGRSARHHLTAATP